MSDSRKKFLVILIVTGVLSIIGGSILNTALIYTNPQPDINAPLLAPIPAAIFTFGALCIVVAIFVGWENKGSHDTETKPSKEPKSMVLKMPRDTREKGNVTLVVRNGDHHVFRTEPEIMRHLLPGMIGVATILDHDLLDFEPDSNQPNLKKGTSETNLDENGVNQP
ncbi:MAG: hypothetical protein ACKVQS_00160 [Fimbriimonadaceae bacterium]